MAPRTSPAAVVLALFLVAGCADSTATQVSCGPVEEQPDGGHQHLVGDTEPPVDYLTVPPTSGWHFRDPDRIRAALGMHSPDDPLTEVEQASVLAVDVAVVTYRDLTDDELAVLADVAAEYEDRVAVTPYERLEPGVVVMAAWRTMQRCDGVDRDTIAAFVEEHAASEPDFTMGGEEHDH